MRKAKCGRCGKSEVWVNVVMKKGRPARELCGDCWDVAGPLRVDTCDPESGMWPAFGSSSGPYHNNPGFENAVRCIEDS